MQDRPEEREAGLLSSDNRSQVHSAGHSSLPDAVRSSGVSQQTGRSTANTMRSQERSREGRSREHSNGRAPGDLPRHFMQLSERDSKTSKGFQMVQELQVWVVDCVCGVRVQEWG